MSNASAKSSKSNTYNICPVIAIFKELGELEVVDTEPSKEYIPLISSVGTHVVTKTSKGIIRKQIPEGNIRWIPDLETKGKIKTQIKRDSRSNKENSRNI